MEGDNFTLHPSDALALHGAGILSDDGLGEAMTHAIGGMGFDQARQAAYTSANDAQQALLGSIFGGVGSAVSQDGASDYGAQVPTGEQSPAPNVQPGAVPVSLSTSSTPIEQPAPVPSAPGDMSAERIASAPPPTETPDLSSYVKGEAPAAEALPVHSVSQTMSPQTVRAVNPLDQFGNLDPHLSMAVRVVESSNNPNAVSPKGAQGLMQLEPPAARDALAGLGMDPNTKVDLKNPKVNVLLGDEYLKQRVIARNGDLRLALADYNAGMKNVDTAIAAAGTHDFDKVLAHLPKPGETGPYVDKVMAAYAKNAGDGAAAKLERPQTLTDYAESAYNLHASGVLRAGEAQQAAAQNEAQLLNQQADTAKAAQDKFAQAQSQQDQIVADTKKKMEDAYAAIPKMDPNHFWNSKSTGDKIGLAIMSILGGFGAGLQSAGLHMHVENPVTSVITGAIDRDLTAQENEINTKRGGYNEAAGVYHTMLAKFGDPVAAKLASRAFMLQTTQMALQSEAAKAQPGTIQGNTEAALGELQQQHAMTMEQLYQMQMASPVAQAAMAGAKIPATGGGPGAGGVTPSADINKLFLDKDTQEHFVEGEGLTYTPDQAKTLNDLTVSGKALMDPLEQIAAIRRSKHGGTFDPKTKEKLEQLASEARSSVNFLFENKRLTPLEHDEYLKMIPENPGEILTASNLMPGEDPVIDSINTLKRYFGTKYNGMVKQYVKFPIGSGNFRSIPTTEGGAGPLKAGD